MLPVLPFILNVYFMFLFFMFEYFTLHILKYILKHIRLACVDTKSLMAGVLIIFLITVFPEQRRLPKLKTPSNPLLNKLMIKYIRSDIFNLEVFTCLTPCLLFLLVLLIVLCFQLSSVIFLFKLVFLETLFVKDVFLQRGLGLIFASFLDSLPIWNNYKLNYWLYVF